MRRIWVTSDLHIGHNKSLYTKSVGFNQLKSMTAHCSLIGMNLSAQMMSYMFWEM